MLVVSLEPNWEPLKKCFNGNIRKVKEFMFTGTTDNGINLYKHIRTRRYINISNNGKYYFLGENYIEIPFSEAIVHVEN